MPSLRKWPWRGRSTIGATAPSSRPAERISGRNRTAWRRDIDRRDLEAPPVDRVPAPERAGAALAADDDAGRAAAVSAIEGDRDALRALPHLPVHHQRAALHVDDGTGAAHGVRGVARGLLR